MSIEERFISYTQIDTTSQETETCPSNPNEFVLAHQLEKELLEFGVENVSVDQHSFVYGTIPANTSEKKDVIGFLAHMDTVNAASGANIKTRIIRNYDGKDIELSQGIYTRVEEYPDLVNLKGKDLIVTDGTTLLGGDDKAGITVIVEMCKYLHEHPEVKHGEVRVCFTPDEETGNGIGNIDLKLFQCDYAYTLDGGEIDEVTYENFNAASAALTFDGISIHPGSAKGKMINACQLAMDFHAMLPEFERPEYTEGREGFNHLVKMEGTCQQAHSYYIIRNHDAALLEKQKHEFELITMHMNEMYGHQVVRLQLVDAYRNMKECFAGKEYIIQKAVDALAQYGMKAKSTPVRGGTDGASLTYKGIPTPNLGNGDRYCHGNHELVCINEMLQMVEIIVTIITK